MILLYKTYMVEYEYLFNQHSQTILLLHGWGGNKDSFAKLKKVFKSNYNILSLSLPPPNLYQHSDQNQGITDICKDLNFNSSTIPLDMYDYKNIVSNILQLLNLKSVTIICHSFGFRVALMLATTKIKISKIIVTGGAGIRFRPHFFKKLHNQFNSIWLKTHPEYFNKIASSEYIHLSKIDRETFKNIINKNLIFYIKILSCPIFLFWGEKDTATPLKMFKIIKKLKPQTTYKIIKNGTHFCYLEHSNLFIDCCQNFIKEQGDNLC